MANDNSNETPTSAQAQPRGVHLVGSVPLNNAEEVFRAASSTLGDRLRRVPDGETGTRTNWIGWQINFLAQNPHLEDSVGECKQYWNGTMQGKSRQREYR